MTEKTSNQPELPLIHVVGALIRRNHTATSSATTRQWDGEILVGQRPLNKSCGGQWEFIGGKIEPGETPSQALARECMEEAALKIEGAQMVAETTHSYPHRIVHLILMECRCAEGSVPVALEHLELRWVQPSQMHDLDFCPADVELIQTLFG